MTEADHLAAIDADPLADAPRLAHADWIEANGDAERADFVREHLYEGPGYRRTLPPLPVTEGMEWEYVRGLPEGVAYRSVAAFRRGRALTAGHRVRHVVFWMLRSGANLAREPGLADVHSLELRGVSGDDLVALLDSPHLASLRRLVVGNHFGNYDGSVLRRLAAHPVLERLDGFEWSFSSMEPLAAGDVADFFASPRIRTLRELRLSVRLSGEAVRCLWDSPHLGDLRVLSLGRSFDSDGGHLQHLGDGRATPALERFHLAGHHTRPGTAAAVAGATRWAQLGVLGLTGVALDDADFRGLTDTPHLSTLRRLELIRCGVSDAGAAALAESRYLAGLRWLDLRDNLVGRAGVAALGRANSLTALRRLRLTGNPAPPEFVAAVEARFREGGPPVEEAAPVRLEAVPSPTDIPIVGQADEDGLIRAILADPFDDVSRLVYADFLEEHGSPEYAAILRAPRDGRAALLPALAEAIGRDAPCKFAASLGEEGLLRLSIPVSGLRLKAFAAKGAGWLRRHRVCEVAPTGASSSWRELLAGEWLGACRGLYFGDGRFYSWDAIIDAPYSCNLAAVTPSNDWRDDPFRQFLARADLRGLCLLRLPTRFSAYNFAALSEPSLAARVRNLHVGGPDDASLRTLADSPAFDNLTTLSLWFATSGGPKILADAQGLAGLRNLDIGGGLAEGGAVVLAASPLWRRLRRLRVFGVFLSPASLRQLASGLPAGSTFVAAGSLNPERRSALEGVACRVEFE